MVYKKIFIPIGILVLLIIFGTFFYHNVEGWRYLDSAYYTVVTITTVGYGDFTPQTDLGKIFMMFFAFSGIAVAAYIFSLIGRYFLMQQYRASLRESGRLNSSKGIVKIKRR